MQRFLVPAGETRKGLINAVTGKNSNGSNYIRSASMFLVANVMVVSLNCPVFAFDSLSATSADSIPAGAGADTKYGDNSKTTATRCPDLRGPLTAGTSSVGADPQSAADSKNTFATSQAQKENAGPSSSGGEDLLRGHVTQDVDTPATILDDLVKKCLARDANAVQFESKGQKYSKQSSQLLQKSKDVANFVSAYKGFERSSEAADVILDEKVKVKSKASAMYAYQRKIDDYNRRVFTAMMQIATGLGTEDGERRTRVLDSAIAELSPLLGDEGAQSALQRLKDWSAALPTGDSTEFAGKPLDVFETEQKVKTATDGALKNDDVVAEIKGRLHKYNQRSKLMRGTAKVVNTTLSIAMLTPNFVSPAAQAAYLAFCIATGGPEDAKLLQALYYDQRFQSRWKVYNHKALLAANNYNMGLLAKNAVLLKFSQSVLSDMESGKTGCVAGDSVASGMPAANKKEAKKAAARSSMRVSHKPRHPKAEKPASTEADKTI